MLTLKDLKEMQPDTIFASGTIESNPKGISSESMSWVAVRGGIYDWAIYQGSADNDFEWIRKYGDKIYDEKLIRELVPCDDEAFKMYRF